MRDSDFKVYRSKFEKEVEKRDFISKLENDDNVFKYLELCGSKPKKELHDLEIIKKLFRDFDLTSDDILFIQGVFLAEEDGEYIGDIINKELIPENEVEELRTKIEEERKRFRIKNYVVKYELFNPFDERVANYSDEKKGILFPSYNDAALRATNRFTKFHLEYLYKMKCVYAKYLMFLKLMHSNYEDVVEYYNNPANYQAIENEVDENMKVLKKRGILL